MQPLEAQKGRTDPHPPSTENPGEGDEVVNSQPDSKSASMLLTLTNCKAMRAFPTLVHGVKDERKNAKPLAVVSLAFESDPC